MRNRILVLSAMVMFTLCTATAIDLNGKWKGDMKTPNGDNLEINFNFHVDGEKLTGTAANTYGEEQITEGTVKRRRHFLCHSGGRRSVQDHVQGHGRPGGP